ncbi:hypothetical protein EDD21DRAFT_442511 [Dissophora ornata]|nr:hypothetical protein EDD21DRAFT_442511 [Dissophora ornata]
MNPRDSIDMAAPNTRCHDNRLSHLSASTVDDDFLSDFHRRSLSGLDSLLSDTTEYDPSPQEESFIKRSGMVTIQRFGQSLDNDQSYYSSQDGEGDIALSPNEQMSSHSPRPSFIQLTEISPGNTIRDVEQPVVKQTVELIQSTPSSPLSQRSFAFDREQLDDPRAIGERALPDDEKKSRMSALFARAASNGDLSRIVDILDNFRDWVDINTHDSDGSTPLIYAACFGQTAVVFMLLDAGAQVDGRDKFGWTALVWATNNKHEDIVRLLLEHGASPSAQTAKGRTVADFLRHDPNDTTKIAQIFKEPSTKATFAKESTFVRANAALLDPDQFYQEIMTEDGRQRRMNMEGGESLDVDMTENANSLADQEQTEDEDEFDWENCRPDQMFVFSSRDIPHIIETLISMEPARSRSYKPIPAYVLLLAARFAHNFSTPELLDELLAATIVAIQSATKNKPDDMALNAHWISNTSSLLHFLRKDASLCSVSESHQEKLGALLLDMVQTIVLDAERRIECVLEPAMLEHDTIVGLDEVKFQSDWAFRFWRGVGSGSRTGKGNKRTSAPLGPSQQSRSPLLRRASLQVPRPSSPRQWSISPRTVTTMLSSLLFVMQIYDVHPEITHYVIAQLLHYISCEVFNLMVENRKFLSRSKALQTRLNLSILEDWLRNNQLPSRLADQLTPLVQLLQLLQVLSLQSDLTTWIETRKKLELLNHTQVKHVVSVYRYEVDEQRLPLEVTKYVLQVAADTEKVRRQSLDRRESGVAAFRSYSSSTRRRSTSLISGMHSGCGFSSCSSSEDEAEEVGSVVSRTLSRFSSSEQGSIRGRQQGQRQASDDEEEDGSSSKTRNSKAWVCFKIPTNLAARGGGIEKEFVPQIPEEVMSLLDSNTNF